MGEDFSSKFSPWLARGCVSPHRIMAEMTRFENAITANESTYWLGFELHWREFFRWTLANLGQDWRVGAAWLEAHHVDYDAASNWANVAGVGTDKRDHGFNVLA